MAIPRYVTRDLGRVLAGKLLPGVTMWNRLEGRPRADNFDRALRAEVRDALWMLTRQWQLGEFQGDDAGSPISVKVRVDTTRLRGYRAGDGPAEPFDDGTPLETRVERMPVPFERAGVPMSLDLRLLLGRYWLKLLGGLVPAVPAAARAEYLTAYPVDPPDPEDPADAPITAHPESWSAFAAAAGRLLDGGKLYLHLTRAGGRASDGIPALAGRRPQVDALGDRFVAWFRKLIDAPGPAATVDGGSTAWQPDRLEYRFAVAAPRPEPAGTQRVMVAEEYFHGRLDWYNLDVHPTADSLDPPGPASGPDLRPAADGPPTPAEHGPEGTGHVTLTMLPTQVTFNGMPNTRWWTFEDGRTNFGDVRPDTTDLAKLLLIEFGLVYANDWFLVPFTVPAGSIATVRGMAVTNVFGERTWVEAAGRGTDDDWQRWAMFLLSVAGQGDEPADLSLLTPPVAQQVLDGTPVEEVLLARDETANMVWGIERTVPLPSGRPKAGAEAADQTRAWFLRDYERRLDHPPQEPPLAEGTAIRYQVMTSVPENWIPLVPARVPDDTESREVQLQRAAMPRVLDSDDRPPASVRPRTSLLRVGLDQTPAQPYFLHEEEVPRAGVRVTQSYQRTRWRDGRAWVWLGVRKQTGRGGNSSGLAFDQARDSPVEGGG